MKKIPLLLLLFCLAAVPCARAAESPHLDLDGTWVVDMRDNKDLLLDVPAGETAIVEEALASMEITIDSKTGTMIVKMLNEEDPAFPITVTPQGGGKYTVKLPNSETTWAVRNDGKLEIIQERSTMVLTRK